MFLASAQYQPLMRMVGLDADAVFTHPDIKPWRVLDDRENCLLEAAAGGQQIRWHIKRYRDASAEPEVQGIALLQAAGIATVPLVGWGKLDDGRSFLITEDLAGFAAVDKLVERGLRFSEVLEPTAALAARLHNAGLHHRDLYLCHFFYNSGLNELRLIDTARVRKLPGWPMRSRWVYKDLGQFWYSTLSLPVTDKDRVTWLARYSSERGKDAAALVRAVERVSGRIGRHDAKLRRRQPHRNISIPT